jgi:hypothetical protein
MTSNESATITGLKGPDGWDAWDCYLGASKRRSRHAAPRLVLEPVLELCRSQIYQLMDELTFNLFSPTTRSSSVLASGASAIYSASCPANVGLNYPFAILEALALGPGDFTALRKSLARVLYVRVPSSTSPAFVSL